MTAADAPHSRPRRGALVAVLVCATVLLAGVSAYWYIRFRQSVAKQMPASAQAAKLASKLSGSASLPAERPTLVTVLDATKLGDTELAKEAKNGDDLLVYPRAKRVILYRPSVGKIIDMFHVESSKTTAEAAPAGATAPAQQ